MRKCRIGKERETGRKTEKRERNINKLNCTCILFRGLDIYWSKYRKLDCLYILSQILQTGQEIQELDHSGFSTQTATVFAGNVGDGRYILQVSSGGVRLLDGGMYGKLLVDLNRNCRFYFVCDDNYLKSSISFLNLQTIKNTFKK